jgi:hypothetical protein
MLSTEVNGHIVTYNDIDDPYFVSIFPLIKPHTITSSNGPGTAVGALQIARVHRQKQDPRRYRRMRRLERRLNAACRHGADAFRRHVAPHLPLRYVRGNAPPRGDRQALGRRSRSADLGDHTAQGKPWGYGGTVDIVRDVMRASGYPDDKLIFVEGMVEDTLPGKRAEQLSLLRLDTDLYKSTYHELVHLYPTLASGGILIIDDYGYFQGARAATDQYIQENSLRIFLSRIDDSVRLAVKP